METAAAPKPKEVARHHYHWSPALDFTFLDLASVADIIQEDPRRGKKYNSQSIQPTDVVDPKEKETQGQAEDTLTKAIRLAYNRIETLSGLDIALASVLKVPEKLHWIDLSFNKLATLDESLFRYQDITTLYLHANAISSLSELDKLARFKHLRSLTLHGNPIESMKGYRQYVLVRLPQLQHLNFSGVTKNDRVEAAKWKARGSELDLRKRVRAVQNAASENNTSL